MLQLQSFITVVDTQYQTKSKIKIIRSDNGLEFNIPSFHSSKGIIHQTNWNLSSATEAFVPLKHLEKYLWRINT